MSKNTRKSDRVLGVAATSRTVHAVLFENGPEGPEVVRRFSRQRAVAATGFEEAVGRPAEPKKESIGGGDDFTIEFGDGGSSNNNLFLNSEFGGSLEENEEDGGASSPVSSFEFELDDILSEAADTGYEDAALAFTLSAADASFVEIKVESPRRQKPDRSTLIEALSAQHKTSFDEERVAFIPMTVLEDSQRRFLAVFPKKLDSVSATLTALREGNDLLPPLTLVDAEVPALLGLARAAKDAFGFHDDSSDADDLVQLFDGEGDEEKAATNPAQDDAVNTIVVRAGAEDTLVLFLAGNTLHHCEILRSLTAFDQAETICSRVLLQQDERGEGDVHHVLVLSEEREADLAESFEVFFPDAKVEQLRSYLPPLDDADEDTATAIVSASAAALRVIEGSEYESSFENINFLPKRLAKRKVKMPLSWHVVGMSVLIVVTTLFFMARYSNADTEISTYRDRLQEVAPEEVNEDITVLQARIDSMQQLYATYTRAIEVLDTLLIGSDRWSRILENTSSEASGVRGLWIESFEESGPHIKIAGNATSRDQVVLFASRIDGTIESLIFSEIREHPVYTYSMHVPVADSLPEAARYLRERVRIEDIQPKSKHSSEEEAGQTDEVRL